MWRSLLPDRLTSKLRPWFYQSGSLPMGWQTSAEWASERHGEGGILHFALRRAAAASLPFPLPPQAEPGRLPTKPANSTHSPSLLFAQPGKPKASQPAKAAPSPHCQPASGQNRRPPNVTRDDTHTHKKGEAKKRTKTNAIGFVNFAAGSCRVSPKNPDRWHEKRQARVAHFFFYFRGKKDYRSLLQGVETGLATDGRRRSSVTSLRQATLSWLDGLDWQVRPFSCCRR